MKHLFPLITTYGLLLSTPILAENNSDLFLPPVIAGHEVSQIEVPLNYEPNFIIHTEGQWERIDFTRLTEDELRQLGYDRLENYKITGIYVSAKSANGQGQVRLCSYTRGGGCYQVSKFNLDNSRKDFTRPNKWLDIPLYLGVDKKPLATPVDIEIKGSIKLLQISVILESIEPIRPPVIRPPHFLNGKTVIYNYGPVLIGEPKKLEKSVSGNSLTRLTMGNKNSLFADYSWVEVSASSNGAVIDRIVVECLDSEGDKYVMTPRLENSRQLRGFYLFEGDTLAVELDHVCAYVKTVIVEGYSPDAIGHRAVISVDLN